MGSNSEGFSIINNASYNLINKKTFKSLDQRQRDEKAYEKSAGELMRKALKNCATLCDFEKLLNENTQRQSANFGVIDDIGGAAFYEVYCENDSDSSETEWEKFDVTKPEIAPSGYLIRTNFSFSGDMMDSAMSKWGVIRYKTTWSLFDTYLANKKRFSVDFVLSKAVRHLGKIIPRKNISDLKLPKDRDDNTLVWTKDCVVRHSTVSSMVVQGVKKCEDPSLTTLWTILGFPLTTLVTPVWVAAGSKLPQWVESTQGAQPRINKISLKLKAQCFPTQSGHGRHYMDLAAVRNLRKNGIYQRLIPREIEIIKKAKERLDIWYRSHFNVLEAQQFYRCLDKYLDDCYNLALGYSTGNLPCPWRCEE